MGIPANGVSFVLQNDLWTAYVPTHVVNAVMRQIRFFNSIEHLTTFRKFGEITFRAEPSGDASCKWDIDDLVEFGNKFKEIVDVVRDLRATVIDTLQSMTLVDDAPSPRDREGVVPRSQHWKRLGDMENRNFYHHLKNSCTSHCENVTNLRTFSYPFLFSSAWIALPK